MSPFFLFILGGSEPVGGMGRARGAFPVPAPRAAGRAPPPGLLGAWPGFAALPLPQMRPLMRPWPPPAPSSCHTDARLRSHSKLPQAAILRVTSNLCVSGSEAGPRAAREVCVCGRGLHGAGPLVFAWPLDLRCGTVSGKQFLSEAGSPGGNVWT